MGKQAAQTLDGAVLYGTPWSVAKGNQFFFENCYGLFQKVIGLSLNSKIRSILPKFEPLMGKEDFEELSHAISTNTSGLDHIDKHVYCKMFGYKDT